MANVYATPAANIWRGVKPMGEICNRDCFNCPYDDCIADEYTLSEAREMQERDKEHAYYEKSDKEKKRFEYCRRYRKEHKEEIAERRRRYYRECKAKNSPHVLEHKTGKRKKLDESCT